jgi:ribosomal protein S18 acetylase RimI-like enzyme
MVDTDNLTWRRGTADDTPLLLALFTADKVAEFVPLGFSEEQLQPLLDMQYRAREVAYSQSYPAAVDMILCAMDGTPVGRHLVERQPTAYLTIDIAVLPEFRRQGIGAWALRQVQIFAELEGLNFRLKVMKTNPALRLYERLGFLKVSADQISYEMEWQPATLRATRQEQLPQTIAIGPDATGQDTAIDRAEVLNLILPFLREIGLHVELGAVPQAVFLPGIQPIRNGLRVDVSALLYPGDLLHEAGHLAVMTPEERGAEFPSSSDAAQEMGAMAWSYAAALHIGLPPEVVFHQHGYRGAAARLLCDFKHGHAIGLPFLWWIGMTTQSFPDRPSIYPRMLHWLRRLPVPDAAEAGIPRADARTDVSLEEHTAVPAGIGHW